MTDSFHRNPSQPFQAAKAGLAPEEVDRLLLQLRRKEGSWVEWGQACQKLQQSGLGPQKIFEDTGFEPIQQNQVIVGAQVYQTLLKLDAPEPVQEHFGRKGSDILYEMRVLSEDDRLSTAALVVERGLDFDEAREVVKAFKELTYLKQQPEGFAELPGDALAWQCWRSARQQADLQSRSRLIAKGLRFAQTPEARAQLEKLLMDFTVVAPKSAPRMPVYRIDSDEEEPRLLAVAGQLPMPVAALRAVPLIESEGPFGMVRFSGEGAWVALPNWQVLRNAEDPIALLALPEQLPAALPDDRPESVMLVIDRADRTWRDDAFFAVADGDENLAFEWFDAEPERSLLGKLILVLRPKKGLDQDYAKELWQVDE
ncbi:RuBisCO accumulation factor 1 [Limnothrix redekei]|uniref:RuBisCO accumulation factor 1 n=1 Tax=Limnothrix redekei LRLZ20PSL1 TaxID=3112953 RepID=A0ABW7CCG9_9CYAN